MDQVRRIVSSALDGAGIEVFSSGTGPGVVVVCGGATDDTVYRRLAERLSTNFTVHVYNRRGRGGSAARPDGYGLATELADLGSVVADADATRLIGHSVGGYFAFVGARELAITKVALFDPVISVDGGFPTDYMPAFERALTDGETLEAMRIMGTGLNPASAKMPRWAQTAAIRAVLLTPPGKTMARLLWTVPAESQVAFDADGPASQWADVTAQTRFYIGAKSPGYYLPAAQQLVAVMPHADIEVIPKLGHDAVARAGAPLVASLTTFLT